MRRVVALTAVAVLAAGCGGGGIFSNNCDKEGSNTRSAYGEPQEIDKYDSGDYHSHTWWYWSRGFSRNFTWSNDISCRTSDYTFAPIRTRSAITDPLAEQERKAASQQFSGR